jgi:acetyltransferase-like isoleucine patch superfamily enzyme
MKITTLESDQLRSMGIQADVGAALYPLLHFETPVRIWRGSIFNGGAIGAFSYLAPNAVLNKTTIGRYCSIGDAVTTLSDHPNDWLSTSPFTYEALFAAPFKRDDYPDYEKLKQVNIGHDVWIGSGARIKGGVSIGNGAIVAAGAMVTKDVAPYAVVGGVPAKLIRMRFGPEMVARLQAVAWWRYDLTALELPWSDIGACLDTIEQMTGQGSLLPYAPEKITMHRRGEHILLTKLPT